MTTTTDDDSTLEQSWSDILTWLQDAGLEQTVANLRPPASDDEIARTEAALGLRMPDDLRWLYAHHDGQHTLAFPPSANTTGKITRPLATACGYM